MNSRSSLFALPALTCLLLAIALLIPAAPVCARLSVDPGSLEFDLPLEVAGRATFAITNGGAGAVQYTITGGGAEGYQATYYRNQAGASPQFGDVVLRRIDREINFDWGNGSPDQAVPADYFGTRWEGSFVAQQAGRHALRTNTDDGVRLYVDDQRVIDDWVDHGPTDRDWAGDLQAGTHRLRMEFYENGGGAVARLYWMPPGAGQYAVMPGRIGAQWLAVQPDAGNIAGRGQVVITVNIVTRGLVANRDYDDTLRIASNDRDTPLILLPLAVHVGPWQPGAVVADPDHVFRALQAGARSDVQVTLSSVGGGNYEFQTRIDGENGGWLTLNPANGLIAPGADMNVTLTLSAAGRQNGVYSLALVLLGNDQANPETVIPVTMAIGVPFGSVIGQVIDERSRQPVAGAHVGLLGHGFQSVTDGEGRFDFGQVPVLRYRLWATAADYLRYQSAEFVVQEGQQSELTALLLHGEFLPDPARIEVSIAPDDTIDFPLTIRNQGNGPLTWTAERVFPEQNQIAPWTRRLRFDVAGGDINDTRISGVEFTGDNFVVTGGNMGRGRGLVYVFDHEGRYVRSFPQFLDGTAWGMRDLAWDEELLWGADGRRVYGFDTEGNLATDFDGPVNPGRAVAFEPGRGLLWLSDVTTDIYGIDRQGNLVERVRNPGVRRFGLAWYENDPDGCKLYMFSSDAEHDIAIQKMNPATREVRFVTDLPGLEADRAGGLAITGLWDPYSFVVVGLVQSDVDAVAVWQLASRTDWLAVTPDHGTVAAGAASEVTVRFASRGLPPEQRFEAALRFRHDGLDGQALIPVQMNVTGAGGMTQRFVPLVMGWNLVSVNVSPEQHEDFGAVVRPLVEAGSLILAKDWLGNFYWPARQFNRIDGWDGRRSYWLKLSARSDLRVTGEVIGWNTPIPLQAGWNSVSYLPRQPIEATAALAGLGDNLIIARDGNGRFCLPAYGYSDIGRMREGAGYQVRVREEADLVYRLGGRAASPVERYTAADLSWLESLPPTSAMHHLIVKSSLPSGSRLEARTADGALSGRGVVGEDGWAGITLRGDDPATASLEGFAPDQEPRLRLADAEGDLDLTLLDGSLNWSDGGWGLAALEGDAAPAEFRLSSAYPNPFNGRLRVSFSLAQSGPASLRAFDLTGREVGVLAGGRQAAGEHRAAWDAGSLPSGVYILRLASASRTRTTKVVLVR